jgi:hypothetical protein
MQPWFIATERFGPNIGDAWAKYVSWSGLTQAEEIVSLDPMLCPTVVSEIKAEYWPYIVNEDFMLNFFTDLDFLLRQVSKMQTTNLLCVFRNPPIHPEVPRELGNFGFVGYDLVDIESSASAITNCGGFPDVFENSELNSKGLLPQYARAMEVQAQLKSKHPEEHHADCHVWAIYRHIEP